MLRLIRVEVRLTMRKMEEPAKASGMATDVILSIGPLRWVCLWMFWYNLCFSISFSLGLKGVSFTILHVISTNYKSQNYIFPPFTHIQTFYVLTQIRKYQEYEEKNYSLLLYSHGLHLKAIKLLLVLIAQQQQQEKVKLAKT